jgi:hypothetical protein
LKALCGDLTSPGRITEDGGANNVNPTLTELVIPDDLAAALAPATGPVDLRTQSGRKLGRYTPGDKPEPPIPWEPDVTREEIDRRIRESKGHTLSDIWKRLGAE